MQLVHASISENGSSGWDGKAKAGDQTGKEVCVRSWYSKPWDLMLRYSDSSIALKAAQAAVKLAKSGLVGYDQSERNSLYKALKKNNFDVDLYIKSGVKTETDCSAFVYAVYCCFIPRLRSDNNAPRTADMRQFYSKQGFTIYAGTQFTSGKSVLNGDIMLKPGSHTALVTDGTSGNTSPVNMIDLPILSPEVDSAITVIARDVLKGSWGNGNERKEKLYVAIQNRVREIM